MSVLREESRQDEQGKGQDADQHVLPSQGDVTERHGCGGDCGPIDAENHTYARAWAQREE